MSSFIQDIEIRNFKSISEASIQGCNRINLFIGKPNVGKSNIIEALSLFSLPYLRENSSRKLTNLIRLENESELFYNGQSSRFAEVSTDLCSCHMQYDPKGGLLITVNNRSDLYSAIVDDKLDVRAANTHKSFETNIKRYSFKQDVAYKKGHSKYLIPPFGYNLLSVLESYEGLKKEVTKLFEEYNLDIAFDKASQTIKVIQDRGEDIFLVPYNSIADTLQRIIFFKAAISSNDNSVLLFEEPEAHSFPPYMSHITQEMIHKKDNQFFVATHSPFILNDLLENGRKELAVFVVSYDNYQTQVKQLTPAQLHSIFQDGVDLFTNYESFI